MGWGEGTDVMLEILCPGPVPPPAILRPWLPVQNIPLTSTSLESLTTTQSSWFQTLLSCSVKLTEFPTLNPSLLCAAERPLEMLFGASPRKLLRVIFLTIEFVTPARLRPWEG